MMKSILVQSKTLKKFSHIQHGFFSRNGGVSTGVYESLNCSYGSNDQDKNISKNRYLAQASLGLSDSILVGVNQIHSAKTHIIHHCKDAESFNFKDGDALVTKEQNITLSVLGADCAPVIFACENQSIIGIAHAGWKGAATGVIQHVIDSMCSLGANLNNIQASIGPTIQQQNYEVKNDFITELARLSGFDTDEFIANNPDEKGNSQFYFDLPAYIKKQCSNAGLMMVDDIKTDTYSNDDYFSFRRNTHQNLPDYGRHISMIALKA